MRFFLLTLIPLLLSAAAIKAPLSEVNDNVATISCETVRAGTAGYILHTFNDDYRSIIATVRVIGYDAAAKVATLKLSPYEGLQQDSLPKGMWKAAKGDTAVIAPGYEQGLLIAPSKESYELLREKNPSLRWIHPDHFAAHLSFEGHPSPLAEDFKNFCDNTSTGLLYLYALEHLFTLDCANTTLLEITPMPVARGEDQLPFYSRLESITADLWGEGSDEVEQYDLYYLKLLESSNPKSAALQQFLKNQSAMIAQVERDFKARDTSNSDAQKRIRFLDPK